jgi:hypothetical protein
MAAFWTTVSMIFTIGVGGAAVFALFRILTAAHRDHFRPQH